MSDGAPATRDRGGEPTTVRRRTVLKGLGAAAVTGAGVTGMAGSASARSSSEVTVIDFEETRDGNFEADGELPVVDELFVFVHGWFGNSSNESQTVAVVNSLKAAGYSPDAVVSIDWPASNPWYPDAESDTEGVGAAMADLIEGFTDGGGNVRLTGHSLGGRVVYWTATDVGSGNEIDTIGAMGTAADGRTVCPDGMWYEGIADNPGPVRNYHSHHDRVVGTAYGVGGIPLGNDGAPCDGASNYEDVDVTSSVSNHLDYIGDEQVGRDLAAVIESN